MMRINWPYEKAEVDHQKAQKLQRGKEIGISKNRGETDVFECEQGGNEMKLER